MVCNVLGEDDERDRHIGHRDGADIAPVQLGKALGSLEEDEVLRHKLIVHERLQRDAVLPQHGELREVEHLQRVRGRGVADEGEHRRNGIAREDAEDERDEADHFLAVGRAEHGHEQGHEAAQNGDERGSDYRALGVHNAALDEVGDGVARQRKADDGNRRADDDDRHEAVEPLDARDLHGRRNDDIHKAGKHRAENKACIAERHGNAACEGCSHAAEEGKRAAKEDRAAEFRKEQVDERADACAEECRGRAERAAGRAVGNDRNDERRRHDGQQLLDGEEDRLAEFRPVLDSEDHVHDWFPRSVFWVLLMWFCIQACLRR